METQLVLHRSKHKVKHIPLGGSHPVFCTTVKKYIVYIVALDIGDLLLTEYKIANIEILSLT